MITISNFALVLRRKGAFIIYEKGGGGGGWKFENFHFFSDSPQNIYFFCPPPPPSVFFINNGEARTLGIGFIVWWLKSTNAVLNFYSDISLMISFGLVFQIYNFT